MQLLVAASSLLLLLVFILLVAGRAGQGLLQDLQDLLILDLLVGLELREIRGVWRSKTGDPVLGDGCKTWSITVSIPSA